VREAVKNFTRRHAGELRPRSLGAGRSGKRTLSERAEALLGGMGRSR
jgi:hypothetical protein